ncbi:MAG: DUF3343 domain-containing protein [Chitinivibrionales bacterium]
MSVRTFFLFKSTRDAIKAERILLAKNKRVKVIPVPRTISSECGMALVVQQEDPQELQNLLTEQSIVTRVHQQ